MLILDRLKSKLYKFKILYSTLRSFCHFVLIIAAFPIKLFIVLKSRRSFFKLVNSCQKYNLYFMHRCGGGTEVYVQNALRNKDGYILLRNLRIFGVSEIYTLEMAKTKRLIYIFLSDIHKLNLIAFDVYIENLYSYKKIETILRIISGFSKKIIYNLHDYFPICYNLTMLLGGVYCGDKCNEFCNGILNGRRYSAKQWHDMWDSFFACVNELIVFSQSSKRIFLANYPDFNKIIIVKPHDLSYFNEKKVGSLPIKMNVGVFGNITYDAKGYSVLKSFAEFSKGRDYKICMNGLIKEPKLDVFSNNQNFTQYGPYKTDEMYKRVISQKIGVVFFTSICPETFSYVVSELILMDVPIVCFDVGAQAEKIRGYRFGKVIPDYKNESILKTLQECYESAKNIKLSEE